MSWKFIMDWETATDLDQWDEMLGKSPWDFITAPDWPGTEAEDPWDFSNRRLEAPQSDGTDGDSDDTGAWELNPLTGVKVWISNR